MIDRIVTIVGATLVLVTIAGPAMAGVPPRALPEPATMSLFGLGVAGAFVTRKFIKRK
jgi:PEP-CTERM motif-containing protein